MNPGIELQGRLKLEIFSFQSLLRYNNLIAGHSARLALGEVNCSFQFRIEQLTSGEGITSVNWEICSQPTRTVPRIETLDSLHYNYRERYHTIKSLHQSGNIRILVKLSNHATCRIFTFSNDVRNHLRKFPHHDDQIVTFSTPRIPKMQESQVIMKLYRSGINLAIVLWNVWLLPSPISYKPGTRAKLISPLLAGHDIIVLNEAFAYKDTLKGQARYNYSVTLDERSWWPWRFRPLDSGLVILSKYPLIRWKRKSLNGEVELIDLLAKE